MNKWMNVRTGNDLMTSGWESRLGKCLPHAQYRVLQGAYKDTVRSRILKRTQKGNEGEPTGCGHSAVNGMSSEILYLLDPAQGLCMPEGNTLRRVIGKLREETRSRTPAHVTQPVIKATSEAQKFLGEP
jgi:hypothetical protein